MARQILTRLPVYADLVGEGGKRVSPDWERYFAQTADEVFRRYKIETTLDPASVSAQTTAEQTFTVEGLNTNDVVRVIKPTHTAGIVISNERVSAADTLAITFGNVSTGAVNPPSETYTIFVMRV